MKKTIKIDIGPETFIRIEGNELRSNRVLEACPDCGLETCARTCTVQAERQDSEREDEKDARLLHNAALHGMESLLLALHCAGVDVSTAKVAEAVKVTTCAIGNEYD